MIYAGRCHFCGDEVPARLAAYPVEGWEAARSQGGANRILGRTRLPGMVAHTRCVQDRLARARAGISPGQRALL